MIFWVFGFASLYFLSELFPVPLFWYFPLENRWEWAVTPGPGLKMGWYGKVLFCLVGSGFLALIGGLVARIKTRSLTAFQTLAEMAAMGSVLFVLYYLAKSMAYRVI